MYPLLNVLYEKNGFIFAARYPERKSRIMINGNKISVVLPAYNAEKTLEQTFQEIPFDIVDDVILVDDRSRDNTVEVAKALALSISSCMKRTKDTGATRKAATTRRWRSSPISWSCSIPITSIPRNSSTACAT